jgi:uncharacterized DUF497 family protein
MRFAWDPIKASANLRKHGIDFPDAVGALEDPLALTMPDDHVDEVRYATVGVDFLGRLIVVIWTDRGESLRMISARKATRRERRLYEE